MTLKHPWQGLSRLQSTRIEGVTTGRRMWRVSLWGGTSVHWYLFRFIHFYFMYDHVCVCAWVCVCTTCVQSLQRPEESTRFSRMEVTRGCELPHEGWQSNPGLFPEQPVALTHWAKLNRKKLMAFEVNEVWILHLINTISQINSPNQNIKLVHYFFFKNFSFPLYFLSMPIVFPLISLCLLFPVLVAVLAVSLVPLRS